MKIAVLGAGAMGGLYSAYLSRSHDVTVVDVYAALVDKINAEGLEVREPDGSSAVYHPKAAVSTQGMEPVDLIVVFVKAMFSESALQNNRSLIGPDTYIMTLQNGSGHDIGWASSCPRITSSSAPPSTMPASLAWVLPSTAAAASRTWAV